MAMFREWLRPRRYLVALFLTVTLVPSVLLIAFGGRMLQQDRAQALLELVQLRDRAADLIVVALEQQLSAAEQSLGIPWRRRLVCLERCELVSRRIVCGGNTTWC